jgi:putative peptidoglycan lipid II flippase
MMTEAFCMPLARDVTTVGSATLLSRLVGFFRDVGIAAVLGAGVLSDAFFAALQIPNLFRRLLAEGALNSAYVPMWLRIKEEAGAPGARRFGEHVLGAMTVSLGLIALLCVVFAPMVVHVIAPGFRDPGDRFPYAVTFVRLSVPYVAVAGVVSIAAATLNAEGRVGAAAFGLVIFNVVMIAAVLAVLLSGVGASPAAGAILSASIVAAGVCQCLLVAAALIRMREPPLVPRLSRSPDVRRFFALMVPGVLAGGVPQLKLMAGAMVASSSQAAVSWLYYANRLYELPLGIVSIAIASVMVPLIAAGVRARDHAAIASAQSRAFEIALALSLPSAFAFALLAHEIAGGLFERGAFGPRDTAAVGAALAAICAGLPGHTLEKVFGAVSFAHEDTRTPMGAALTGLAAATGGALILFPTYGHVGVAAAIALSGWVGAALMWIVLLRRGWLAPDRDLWRRLPRIVLATALMGLALIALKPALAAHLDVGSSSLARVVELAVLVAAGLAVYLAALQALGVARLRDLTAAIRHGL